MIEEGYQPFAYYMASRVHEICIR